MVIARQQRCVPCFAISASACAARRRLLISCFSGFLLEMLLALMALSSRRTCAKAQPSLSPILPRAQEQVSSAADVHTAPRGGGVCLGVFGSVVGTECSEALWYHGQDACAQHADHASGCRNMSACTVNASWETPTNMWWPPSRGKHAGEPLRIDVHRKARPIHDLA